MELSKDNSSGTRPSCPRQKAWQSHKSSPDISAAQCRREPLPPHGDVGRGRSGRRNSQPDPTAGFPEPRLICQGGGNRGEGGTRPGGVASRLCTAPPANRIPRRRRKVDFTPPPCRAPKPHEGDPLLVSQPQRASARLHSRGPAHLGRAGGVVDRKQHSARAGPAPFSTIARARRPRP